MSINKPEIVSKISDINHALTCMEECIGKNYPEHFRHLAIIRKQLADFSSLVARTESSEHVRYDSKLKLYKLDVLFTFQLPPDGVQEFESDIFDYIISRAEAESGYLGGGLKLREVIDLDE